MNKEAPQVTFARLEVSTGEFVAHVEVLPFNEPPEVLIWGARVFKLHSQAKNFPHDCDVYRECFAVYVWKEV